MSCSYISVLLERVFLCLGSADTDEQLQASVWKFLPPVLLKLSSPQDGVRKKVMGLLIHINKRLKSRPKVQLPVEALLLQYQPSGEFLRHKFHDNLHKAGLPAYGDEEAGRAGAECLKRHRR